jgi:hypothetical protein
MFTINTQTLRRIGCIAVCLFVSLGPMAGCALWDAERWNIDRYRDERATDIEQRLSSQEPIVQNPF